MRLESPGIELFTDAGESAGRHLMERFGEAREIFRQAGIEPGPLRLRVFVFASAEEYHRYRGTSDGFYQSGADHDSIAMHAGSESGRVAFHEYVHLVLRHSAVPLPRWFDEGMAEFYSNARVENGRLHAGAPIPAHLALLAREPWLDAAGLAAHPGGAVFYAESWALVQMLNLAPEWRGGMPQFVLLLAREKPVDHAFRQAFGKSMSDALAALPGHLKSIREAVVPIAMQPLSAPRIARIGGGEAAIACARLALDVGRPELADALISTLPESADAEAMRGAVALAQNRREEARRHLDRAIQLGSRDASLYFEYAMLETGASNTDLLRRTIALDPDFAEAQFLVGVRETDAGSLSSALEHLRAAARLRPDRSTYWHALGYAQAKSGLRKDAADSARRALATAQTDSEEQAARALLDFRPAPAPPAKRPGVITPPSWNRGKGDARIEGTIVEFDCGGAVPRIEVRDASGAVTVLDLISPGEIELVNAPGSSFQFSCGPQNLRVAVDYDSVSRRVTRIEFRL